MQLNRKFRV